MFNVVSTCFGSDFDEESESDLLTFRFGDPLTAFGFRVGETDPSPGANVIKLFTVVSYDFSK